MITFQVDNANAYDIFKDEKGGHRWQRIPPTEKRGRVHTSTITVSVLPKISEKQLSINAKDLDWKMTRGSGPGGQHRNKTESAVQLTHIPTKTTVRCESERSQYQNKISALDLLRAKLWNSQQKEFQEKTTRDKKQQVGSGMRGDKRRTISIPRDEVVDHVLGKRWKYKDYSRGEI